MYYYTPVATKPATLKEENSGQCQFQQIIPDDSSNSTQSIVSYVLSGLYTIIQLFFIVVYIIRVVDLIKSKEDAKYIDYILLSILILIQFWKLFIGVIEFLLTANVLKAKGEEFFRLLIWFIVFAGLFAIISACFFIYMLIIVDPSETPAKIFALVMLIMTIVDYAMAMVTFIFLLNKYKEQEKKCTLPYSEVQLVPVSNR